MFRLAKWYLDLVAEDGTALITYAASLRWGAIRLQYASTILSRTGTAPIERSQFTRVQLPDDTDDVLHVSLPGLGLTGEWCRTAAPIQATLLADASGVVQWDCLLPSGRVAVELNGESLTGAGYAERLTLTCPPWSLPFRRLRWGRYVGATRSLVWIDWDHDAARRWVWVDGQLQPGAVPAMDAVTCLRDAGGGVSLRLTPERVLCERRALQVIAHRWPAFGVLPLGPLRDLHETKRLARGSLHGGEGLLETGWVIHEEVAW
jgi:hypothetical protein